MSYMYLHRAKVSKGVWGINAVVQNIILISFSVATGHSLLWCTTTYPLPQAPTLLRFPSYISQSRDVIDLRHTKLDTTVSGVG